MGNTAVARHRRSLWFLLGAFCLLQAWMIVRAPVPALDAVRFVGQAKQLDQTRLLPWLEQQDEQPLFSAAVWLVHRLLVGCVGPIREGWALSAQLAAAIPLVLAVLPVWLVARRQAGTAAAGWATLLFCCLPRVARLGSEGISDSIHLLCFALAYWLLSEHLSSYRGGLAQPVRGAPSPSCRPVEDAGQQGRLALHRGSPAIACLRSWWVLLCQGPNRAGRTVPLDETDVHCVAPSQTPSVDRTECLVGKTASPRDTWHTGAHRRSMLWVLAAGTIAGIGALCRAEILVLPMALVTTLVLLELLPSRRESPRQLLAVVGCFAAGWLTVWGPYLAATRSWHPRVAAARLLGRPVPEPFRWPAEEQPAPSAPGAALPVEWHRLGAGSGSFAPKETSISIRQRGLASAARNYVQLLSRAFAHVVGLLALIGLAELARRLTRPENLLGVAFFALHSAVLIGFAAREGYVSSRHMLPLVVVSVGCAATGALTLGRWTAGVCNWDKCRAWLAAVVAMVLTGWNVAEPLHADHVAHRQAARWLADRCGDGHTATSGTVLDTRGWTGLYSGWTTYDYRQAQRAFSDSRLRYVVVETWELQLASKRSDMLRRLLGAAGTQMACFPDGQGPPHEPKVLVFGWDAQRFLRFTQTAPATDSSGEARPVVPRGATRQARFGSPPTFHGRLGAIGPTRQ